MYRSCPSIKFTSHHPDITAIMMQVVTYAYVTRTTDEVQNKNNLKRIIALSRLGANLF